MKSNLSEPGVKKVNKKKVIWADEKSQSLVQTSFFEVDDSELSDMHIFARQCAANISIAQLEKVMERDLRNKRGNQDNNSNDNDDKQYSTPLPRLIKIIIPDTIQIPQIISQERFIQEEREKTVLQALFIRKFLPDSPGEPDGESVGTNTNNCEPKLIPLEDVKYISDHNKTTNVSILLSFSNLRIHHQLFRIKYHQQLAIILLSVIQYRIQRQQQQQQQQQQQLHQVFQQHFPLLIYLLKLLKYLPKLKAMHRQHKQ